MLFRRRTRKFYGFRILVFHAFQFLHEALITQKKTLERVLVKLNWKDNHRGWWSLSPDHFRKAIWRRSPMNTYGPYLSRFRISVERRTSDYKRKAVMWHRHRETMLMLGLRYQGGKLAEKNIVWSGVQGQEKWHGERERLYCYYYPIHNAPHTRKTRTDEMNCVIQVKNNVVLFNEKNTTYIIYRTINHNLVKKHLI